MFKCYVILEQWLLFIIEKMTNIFTYGTLMYP